jgi:origin recognition complex subunit 4
LAEERDIYDDIEGALPREGVSTAPSPTPNKTLSSRRRKKLIFDPSLPHPFKSSTGSATPGRSARTDASNGNNTNPKPLRTLVNGVKHGVEEDLDKQDELAGDISTPTRRIAKARMSNGTAASPLNRSEPASAKKPGRRISQRGADSADDESSDQLQANGTNGKTLSKVSSARKALSSGKAWKQAVDVEEEEQVTATPSILSRRKKAPISNSDDELGDHESPSKTKKARIRRTNRADHFNNRDDPNVFSDEVEVAVAAEIDGTDGEAMSVDGSVLDGILDPTEPSPFNRPSPAPTATTSAPVLGGSFTPGPELNLLKTIVMERITGKRPAPLVGLDEEYKSVHQLVEHTITAGEGNSMLLIGARGSGKTTLVNKVLSEVSKDNGDDYHIVRLNGFIHTDDKIALREIWRQLGKEMEIEEDGSLGKNYADTLTTLLALLSHPDEQAGELTDQVAKAVIFVMDEFEQFASHPRQTLLYNLFDIAQSRKAPIAVLGLTTRIDVVNSLEKRVKSRFSHRYVHLSLAKTFTAFQETCKASLIVQPDQLSVTERTILTAPIKTLAKSKTMKRTETASTEDMLSRWNSNISVRRSFFISLLFTFTNNPQSLFASKSYLTQHLAAQFYLTKSVPSALACFLYPTAMLNQTTPLQPSSLLAPPNSKLDLLPSLSTLSLSLLIAAARLDIIHDSDQCNFNMAYDEYVTLASKARIQSAAGGASASSGVSKVWGKEVAKREWEGLVELGLVLPVVQGQASGFGMVRVDLSLVEIGEVLSREKGIEKSLERWCRQL